MTACHETSPAGAPGSREAQTRVLLVGNPNVGKSTLFNAMTGARQRVMNAPGTTVELSTGSWHPTGSAAPLDVVDLPGTYSLVARSPDEQVVCDALRGDTPGGPDLRVAVVVLDATALSRSLYLLAQVARTGVAVVVAVTMLDVARAHGTPVDVAALASRIGVPVAAVDPRTGSGLEDLARAVRDHGGIRVRGIHPGADTAPTDDLTSQLAAAEVHFAWVEEVVGSLGGRPTVRRTRTDRVDRALLNPWLGLPVFLATLWALFELTTRAATPVMDLVDRVINGPVLTAAGALLEGWAPSWLVGLVVDGVLAGVGTVLTFLPLMAIVYTALALLEDSGYMARAAFLADRAMRAIGLDGRAMLPLIIGFGCNVPALAATRTLPDARRRLLTGLLVPWTSCAARLTVYILLASIFFPEHAGTAIFAMYVLSVVLVVGGGLLLRRTLFRDLTDEPLLLVLPAYQRPRLRPILTSVASRVRSFASKAGRIIVVTLTVVWVLMAVPATGDHPVGDVPVQESLYGRAAQGAAPVFAPAGFGDWHLTAALATGFVAKEVVVGALAQSYAVAEPEDVGAPDAVAAPEPVPTSEAVAGTDGPAVGQESDGAGAPTLSNQLRTTFEETSGGHASAAALAFMVFVLGYTPCLATVAEQWRRFGAAWTLGAVGVQLVVAWVLAVLVFQVARLL
ncbi:ferrous iron transporter B [Actinotalea sp. K2]|uniref:ferrous iron transporter B n=1 Tax=Actinotalea sp. K2 TaxID=2939438 RepID=UPI0020179C9B|nr:ferrous iron transporter B [Actinotalea sp. K2]MCL3862437.1 ferrous iron transporter B [Actinotalea sp. K2]